MGEKINSYKELRVFQTEMDAAMKIFEQLLKEMKDAPREGGPDWGAGPGGLIP